MDKEEFIHFHINRDINRPAIIYPDMIQNKELSLSSIGLYCLLLLLCNQQKDWEHLYNVYDENSINTYLRELQDIGLVTIQGTTIGIRE